MRVLYLPSTPCPPREVVSSPVIESVDALGGLPRMPWSAELSLDELDSDDAGAQWPLLELSYTYLVQPRHDGIWGGTRGCTYLPGSYGLHHRDSEVPSHDALFARACQSSSIDTLRPPLILASPRSLKPALRAIRTRLPFRIQKRHRSICAIPGPT